MPQVLLSTDVILEAILNRDPLVEPARIWFKSDYIKGSAQEGVVEVYLTEISRDIIYFILSSRDEQKAKEYISFVLNEYKVFLTTDYDLENQLPKNIYQEKNDDSYLRRILTRYEKEYARKNGYYYVTLEPLLSVNNDISRVITPQMLVDSLYLVKVLCDDMSNNAASQEPQASRVELKTDRLRTQRRETLRQILDEERRKSTIWIPKTSSISPWLPKLTDQKLTETHNLPETHTQLTDLIAQTISYSRCMYKSTETNTNY